MELYSNDMAFNVIISVLIVCFLLQIAGMIDLHMMLEDPLCAAIFLLLATYVAEKEVTVGLLLALVYVMMKGREVEGFTTTGTQATSTAVAVAAPTTSTAVAVAEPTTSTAVAVAAPTTSTAVAVAAPTTNTAVAVAAPTTNTAVAVETSTAVATQASTSNGLVALTSNTTTGGGHPQKLNEIVQQMNGLGANTDDSLNVENFIGRDGKHAPSVQKKIDNIRNNLGKIQSTIAALKNTPDSLQ